MITNYVYEVRGDGKHIAFYGAIAKAVDAAAGYLASQGWTVQKGQYLLAKRALIKENSFRMKSAVELGKECEEDRTVMIYKRFVH